MEHKRLFLLDAYALIFRAYYALIKMPRITSTGLNTSAVFGFVNTLEELLRKEKPTHIAICFDPPGPTFRHEAFEAYKGEREATPEDIKISVPIIKEIIRAYRIPIIEVEGYEADDVIGTLATKAGNEGFSTFMMTPDKDFGQLVSDNVFQYKPGYRGGEFEIRGVKEVCERYEISSPDKVIVVEGKYDAIRLANIVDAAILRTEGFGVFKDHEKQELLRTLADKRGLLVLTDGDSAGMLIRNHIRGLVPAEQITDVYVPDLYGKEKRKDKPSKEGKLGVEGIPDSILIDALKKAGVTEAGDVPPEPSDRRPITRLDFYRDGLSGGPNSKAKRLALQDALGLPERMTGKQLLRIINMMVSYDEYRALVD